MKYLGHLDTGLVPDFLDAALVRRYQPVLCLIVEGIEVCGVLAGGGRIVD
jgi:hypothetical protein